MVRKITELRNFYLCSVLRLEYWWFGEMSPCVLWGDIFCWECGDWVVRRRDVGILGGERGVRECCFVVVKWGIFGGLVRRFFRMSVVEWLYTFVLASVHFLVKIYPFTEKYNTMVKRLHFSFISKNSNNYQFSIRPINYVIT